MPQRHPENDFGCRWGVVEVAAAGSRFVRSPVAIYGLAIAA